jgi:formate dehydrogenase
VAAACAKLEPRADLLIEHLHRLQDAHRCLRKGHLAALAERLLLSLAEVYEVATFYHHFDVLDDDAPAPPPITARVCTSISCALAGGHELCASLKLNTNAAQVRVVEQPCIGACHRAPAVMVGRNVVQGEQAALRAIERNDTSAAPGSAAVDYEAYQRGGGYALLKRCMNGDLTADGVMDVLDAAVLRGLGGAGFPSARKWRTVRAQAAPRHMVVNIDEGEPGTFKDGHYLAKDPHRFIEGMLIAAWAVQAERIFIYLRDEYHPQRELLEHELAALRANPPCALPNIELRRGAGAYICGEESALIESLEGRRGWPRLRPPIVAQVGVFGRPTLAHNLETLHWIREILERGAAWYSAHGASGRSGLRSFSVSGRVKHPGVYIERAGVDAQTLIDRAGGMQEGHELYGYLPGGASGGILPASLAHEPLDFDTLAPHGAFVGSMAVVVFSTQDKARDVALNLMQFFAHESCGQCTPCRSGTAKAVELMQAPVWDEALLKDLCQVMRDASICGLGQAAPNPVDSVLRYFAQEVR